MLSTCNDKTIYILWDVTGTRFLTLLIHPPTRSSIPERSRQLDSAESAIGTKLSAGACADV